MKTPSLLLAAPKHSSRRASAATAPRIAVLVETSRQYGRDVLAGIHAWMAENQSWQIQPQDRCLDTGLPDWFDSWRGDGILFHSVHEDHAAGIMAKRLPAVMLNQPLPSWRKSLREVPSVFVDSTDAAARGVKYFRRLGFRRFAYCGFAEFAGCPQRANAFSGWVAGLGLPCTLLDLEYDREGWESHQRVTLRSRDGTSLETTLASLPAGTAMQCFNDEVALRILSVCNRVGIRVPQDLAVLGLDNDPLVCALTRPGLSSIETNAFQHGYEAARILSGLLEGCPPERRERPVPIRRVVERGSTDAVACRHPVVRDAVQRIRESSMGGLNIKALLDEIGVSRSSLDTYFRREFGQTAREYLMRHRLEGAAKLLRTTSLPQTEVAKRSGFLTASHFNRAFRTAFGQTPGSFRATR